MSNTMKGEQSSVQKDWLIVRHLFSFDKLKIVFISLENYFKSIQSEYYL